VLARALRAATWLFLASPVLIFSLGWLRAWLGLPLASLIAAGVAAEVRRAAREARTAPPARNADALPLWAIALGLLPITALVLMCGAGGVGWQALDWTKHNALLRDLIDQPWPVAWDVAGERLGLVYYVAWYLPAALAGKLGGWELANAVLFATTLAGALLAALWVMAFARGAPVVAGLVLAGFAGLDVLSRLPGWEWELDRAWRRIWWGFAAEWWAEWLDFPGTVGSLFWAPPQLLGSWLSAALVVDATRRRDGRFPPALLLALASLWSAFGSLGVAALAWAPAAVAAGAWRERLRRQLSLATAAGVALGAVVVVYYAARFEPYALPAVYTLDLTTIPNGLLPAALGLAWPEFFRRMLGFWLLEFGVLGALLACLVRPWRAARSDVLLLAAALLALCALSFFRYGRWNDLAMRGSAPALFVLLVLAAGALRQIRTRPVAVGALALVLALGSLTSLSEVRRIRNGGMRGESWFAAPDLSRVYDLFEQHLGRRGASRFDFVMQYVGPLRAPFFAHLAPRAEPRRITAHERAAERPASGEGGAQPPEVADQPPGLRGEPARPEAAPPPAAGPEADLPPADPAAAHEQHGERDVRQLEARGHVGQAGRERGATHQAVRNVGVRHRDARDAARDDPQHARDPLAPAAVAPAAAQAEQRVDSHPLRPEPGEVARIALAVGVQLEDPRRSARERGPIAGEAGGAVAGVRLPHERHLRVVARELREDGRRRVARAVVHAQQLEGRRGGVQRRQPFAHDTGHGLGLVVHRHHDEELGGHCGAPGRGERS
jgi:hypothetical protein